MANKVVRLSDLYQVGKELMVEGPEGKVTVWLQKLSPIDHETCLRKAASARAKVLALARSDEDETGNELKEAVISEFYDVAPTREQQIDFLVSDKLVKMYSAKEAEIGAEDEWSKDNFLQGLKDAWNEELADRFVNDPEDEEAAKVKSELERFQNQVNKEIEDERTYLKKEFDVLSNSKLVDKGSTILLESSADMAWLAEFRKCELWLGVRELKSKQKYFKARSEVDELSVEVLGELMRGYAELNVEALEAKKSEEDHVSSN